MYSRHGQADCAWNRGSQDMELSNLGLVLYSLQWYLLGQVEATKQLICHLVSQPESKTSTTCCSNELHNLVDLESSMAFSSMFQSICRPVIPVIQSSIRPPRIHTKATQPLWELGMNFGARFAYDSAQCAGPWSCDLNYQRFGSPQLKIGQQWQHSKLLPSWGTGNLPEKTEKLGTERLTCMVWKDVTPLEINHGLQFLFLPIKVGVYGA